MRTNLGIALIESLVALLILSTAALSTVTWIAAVSRDLAVLQEREAETQGAERILIPMVLLSRRELEQRIGERVLGDFLIRVDRPEADLFRVAVSRIVTPKRELVATVVYRPI